jgi:hypothetical protein
MNYSKLCRPNHCLGSVGRKNRHIIISEGERTVMKNQLRPPLANRISCMRLFDRWFIIETGPFSRGENRLTPYLMSTTWSQRVWRDALFSRVFPTVLDDHANLQIQARNMNWSSSDVISSKRLVRGSKTGSVSSNFSSYNECFARPQNQKSYGLRSGEHGGCRSLLCFTLRILLEMPSTSWILQLSIWTNVCFVIL